MQPETVPVPEKVGLVDTEDDPLVLWVTDCVTVVQTVGEVVTDDDDESVAETVPVTEPEKLGEEEEV